MKRNRSTTPTMTALLAGGARWWAIFTFAFFAIFPFVARPLLDVLRFVLEGLNSFGSGY